MFTACNTLIDAGDREEFEAFYKKHLRLVYAAAFSVLHDEQLSEDAAMEAFMYIAAHFGHIKALDEAACRRYVYLISRSRATDLLRKESKAGEPAELTDEAALDDGSLSGYETVHIKDCIMRLSKDERQLLYMSITLDMDSKAIAELLGISPEGARKRLQRARAHLRKLIEEGSE